MCFVEGGWRWYGLGVGSGFLLAILAVWSQWVRMAMERKRFRDGIVKIEEAMVLVDEASARTSAVCERVELLMAQVVKWWSERNE